MGLLSRFIPFSYDYELSKIRRIFQHLESEEQQESTQQKIVRTRKDVKGNLRLFGQLEMLSVKVGEEAGGYGFRMQRNLQALAKANAVLNGRAKVVQNDIDKLIHLGNWMNFRFNPL